MEHNLATQLTGSPLLVILSPLKTGIKWGRVVDRDGRTQDYCWQPGPAFVWPNRLDAIVPRALVIFKDKQCDTTQSCRTGFIFKIVEVHGRFRRTKNEKNLVCFGLIGLKFFAIKYRICVTSGFRYEVDNCALLGYYAASSVDFLPTFRNHLSKGPETSVLNYHYSLRNNPEECSYQMQWYLG